MPTTPARWTLAALCGALTTLAFPNTGWWPLAFLGVAGLYVALQGGGLAQAMTTGMVWGASFFTIHLYWARIATDTVPWLALSLMEAGFVAIGAGAYAMSLRVPAVARRSGTRALGFMVIFCGVEYVRSSIPFGGFPWGLLAFSQAAAPTGRWAWLTGQMGVSAACWLAGAMVAIAITHRARARLIAIAAAALAIGIPLTFPLHHDGTGEVLAVGAVQGNVTKPGLGSFANRGEVLANHVQGTYALLDDVAPGELDVVLWPENGSDQDPQTVRSVAADIDAASRAVGAPIVVGAQEYPASGGRFNVALLWEPGVGVTDRYAKQHPAPFGEYIPLRSLVGRFSDQVDRVSTDMIPGHDVGLMRVPTAGGEVMLGTLICFEVAYEPLIYQSVTAGAQALVIPTNNASFGYSAESTQQLAMSQLRAISTGRATIQISTVGVSGVIAPDGTITERTDLFTADQLIATIPLHEDMTPATRAGLWPSRIILAAAIAVTCAGIVAASTSRLRRRRRS